jgi:hypothetical protein
MQSLGNYGSDSEEEGINRPSGSPDCSLPSGFDSIQETEQKEREEKVAEVDQQLEEFLKELDGPSVETSKSTQSRIASPPKRKLEAIQLEVVDETRQATITERIASILQKQGYVASHLPKGTSSPPDDALVEKIALWTSVREKGLHFNQRLLNTHAFCNPLIMNKMISYMELDENGTNYSSSMLDPTTILALPDYTTLSTSFVDLVDRKLSQRQILPKQPADAAKVSKQQLQNNFQKSQWKQRIQ